MSSPLQTLLDAKPLGDDRFEARSIEYLRPRVFGGELLAQVLAASAKASTSTSSAATKTPTGSARRTATPSTTGWWT